MIPCLYDSREMKFDNNGIGKLADAQSCTVTEKRNGSYELKLICPADGIHAEMLEEGNVILAKPSDTMQPQPFRIYKITTPIDGKLEVQARHISYQLNFITVSPFSVSGCAGAVQGLKSHAASDCPFSVWTDVASSAMFTVSVPASFRNCLGGMDGSVLDTFGGEFEWDRYTVKFHRARGADHNVHIVYGKNLTDFKMEKSIENTITGVHPYWVDNETQAVMELPEKVVMVSRKSVPYQKITVLDCTSAFQEKPSEAALREYAQDYIDTTSLTEPEVDIKIDFIQLWNTPGYEDVVQAEQVSLCDTVHVYISKLGIEASSKVTETEYDSLLERYNSITLSNSTVSSRNSSLTSSLNSIRNTATAAYDTAVRVETAVGEQMGGISASIIYDGALFAALFGLHYKNETDSTLTYINVVSLLVLPLAALIFVFSKEIVQILFGRGAFNENTVLFVSRALKIYALGIVGASFRDVLNKVFYSMKDTKTPMINGTIAVAVNIGLNILLVKKFEYLGLALATSVSATVCTILLLIQMCKKMDGFKYRKAIRTFMKAFLAMTCMCAGIEGIMPFFDSLNDLCRCFGGGIIGVVIYVCALLVFREQTIRQAINKVEKKFKRD